MIRLTRDPSKRPPTVGGVVNIGMEGAVYFPSLEEQQAGFVPRRLKNKGLAEDATKLVLLQFAGIYKPVVTKGAR